MSKVLITHSDLDGVTCAILFKVIYPDGKYYLENYDTVDDRIKKVLEEKPKQIFITDISPSQEVAQLLDEEYPTEQKVFLFDHHKTALDLNKYPWATIDTSKCGAVLFYIFLKCWNSSGYMSQTLEQYIALVLHTNNYDLWIRPARHFAVINSLLCTIGHDRFINRFLHNPSVELTETEQYLLQIEKEKEEKYVQEAVGAGMLYESPACLSARLTGRFAVTAAERYTSEIGHKMLEILPIDVAVIVNAQKGIVSLRSKEADVSIIAKALGGGGHPRAAGFMLPKRFLLENEIALLLMGKHTLNLYSKGGTGKNG